MGLGFLSIQDLVRHLVRASIWFFLTTNKVLEDSNSPFWLECWIFNLKLVFLSSWKCSFELCNFVLFSTPWALLCLPCFYLSRPLLCWSLAFLPSKPHKWVSGFLLTAVCVQHRPVACGAHLLSRGRLSAERCGGLSPPGLCATLPSAQSATTASARPPAADFFGYPQPFFLSYEDWRRFTREAPSNCSQISRSSNAHKKWSLLSFFRSEHGQVMT